MKTKSPSGAKPDAGIKQTQTPRPQRGVGSGLSTHVELEENGAKDLHISSFLELSGAPNPRLFHAGSWAMAREQLLLVLPGM